MQNKHKPRLPLLVIIQTEPTIAQDLILVLPVRKQTKKDMFYLIFKTSKIAYWKTLKLIDQKMRASGSFLRFIMLEKLNKETT